MSEVFFTDMNSGRNGTLLMKFENLITRAGIDKIDFKDKFVAVKLHMGEWGNMVFLRQQYAKILCDHIKAQGGKPFITDCNTLYPGKRGNAWDHLESAAWNGYNQLCTGVPVIIADGLRGADEREIPLENYEYCKAPKIGSAIAEADIIISLAHAKGHESAGFGGCLKNLGMGSGSKNGKMEMHSQATPKISKQRCVGCGNCVKHCANGGVSVIDGKAVIDEEKCLGCCYCMSYCASDAILCKWDESPAVLNCKIAEYASAVLKNKPAFFINIATDIQELCDCEPSHSVNLVPDVGFFASFDPVAIDQATIDMINKQPVLPNSKLGNHECACDANKDIFKMSHSNTNWQAGLEHAEKIGLGKREYELKMV